MTAIVGALREPSCRGASAHIPASSVAGVTVDALLSALAPPAPAPAAVEFPKKVDLFGGVRMTPTTYDEVIDVLIRCARARQPATADFGAVHVLATAARDAEFRRTINALDIVAPDGQPVRWAMNYFHHSGLTDRVYGPELMRRLCQAAADKGVPVYLYGSSPTVLGKLSANLTEKWPGLVIAGVESPPFRALTDAEHEEAAGRINASGAGLVFIGLGCPKQEAFAYRHRHSIRAVQVCVGAAFDFHAGFKPTAPAWMQKRGLEWVYRVFKEPRRLWKRYLVTNTAYCLLFAKHAVLKRIRPGPVAAERRALEPVLDAG
jgi:N-acetylglucosaminyldiphosphoundecaprenol N-acetyl-beta-D-mannosaminyltransferase